MRKNKGSPRTFIFPFCLFVTLATLGIASASSALELEETVSNINELEPFPNSGDTGTGSSSGSGGPSFSQRFVVLPDIEDVGGIFGFPSLPDAPQAGSPFLIDVNDRRALDAVWRDNSLWMVTTIEPNFGSESETTAFWVRLDTSANTGIGGIVVADSGLIGGEDISTDTTTFFPSVAVNGNGETMFGFSASAPDIFAGAFAAGRQPGDPITTVQGSRTIKAGEGPYKRFSGGTRNRWGDYSGIAVDPSNDNFFWVFNEFADAPGSAGVGSAGPEDGRWGTVWGRVSFKGKK